MIDLLENILIPGGRARISPYIQDAQLQVLFGKTPEPNNRHDGIRSILAEHEQGLQNLTETYIRFANAGRQFIPTTYQQTEFLKLYLAYYLTTNVSKIQLCLLDLVRSDKITSDLKIIDIGVGAGTTAIATLDFLLAWETACHLVGKTFPVKSLTIECYDISKVCLEMAEKAVSAFCDSVFRRNQDISDHGLLSDGMNLAVSWGKSVKWIPADVSELDLKHSEGVQVLLFASNVLTESSFNKSALESLITGLPNGSIATVIVSGDQKQCCELNTWKAELLFKQKGRITSLFPCGEGIIDPASPCNTCWNSRRESLHEPQLYKTVRKLIGDSRGFNEYDNNLLSWSHSCLELNEHRGDEKCEEIDKSEIITRIFGKFWQKKQKDARSQLMESGPDALIESDWREFFRLCPLTEDGKTYLRELLALRLPGYILPPLSHGSKIKIVNGQLQKTQKEGQFFINLDETVEVKAYETPLKSDNFLTEYTNLTRGAIDEIAFRLFGFSSMRPFQHEILSRVLTGHSILGIAATGGGKSECYILPAMLFSGLTIVVTPLKSLMQDQFDKRIDERYGLKNLATFINSDVSFKEKQARLRRLEKGYYKLVFLTPEQIQQPHILNALKTANKRVGGIRYLALDEAHCISQWGHDFRDSYLNLVTSLSREGIFPVRIALTATASPEVRADLCEELKLNPDSVELGGDVYIYSSNRAELNLIVKTFGSTQEKADDIRRRLKEFTKANRNNSNRGAAIVFMPRTGEVKKNNQNSDTSQNIGRLSSRVSDFSAFLERDLGERVAIYHGKMEFDQEVETDVHEEKQKGDMSGRYRKSEQTAFIDGERAIMVATKGFGMGIDKPNIRLIIHRTPTTNLEAYAQEAGRAGRDGEISDVVLYYSPDTPNDESSDHSIQKFFLSQKCIRRIDVIAMQKYLISVKREICGRLYFTSDEILPYFDKLETDGDYSWPEFLKRQKTAKRENPEHTNILNRGDIYSKKVKHIDRILSALYRIRPKIGEIKRVCLISSVQKCGAKIKFREPSNPFINSKDILKSNSYFGEILRKRFSEKELRDKLIYSSNVDTVEFSRLLGMPLSETASMLLDIKKTDEIEMDGKYGKWLKSQLLDMKIEVPKYGDAEGINNVDDWLDYAGAWTYAKSDYFGEHELTKPRGWEVLSGSALTDPILFEKYLDAFMEAHDRREANDQASYNLLLTDYVGVNEDGTLPDESKTKCLRAVLLGYLKTGEGVLGNCRSCSICVPDGNFELDMKVREQLVERIGTEIKDLLDLLEGHHASIPIGAEMQQLWKHVEEEEARGRLLLGTVVGWIGRCLNDTPGHKTASWIRVDGMIRGILPLQRQEVSSRALDVLTNASDTELPILWETISLLENVLPDVPEAILVRAKACQRMKRIEEARSLWIELLKHPISKHLQHTAQSALCSLYVADGPIPDTEQFIKHATEAARSAPDFATGKSFYTAIRQQWSWAEIRTEILWHHEQRETSDNAKPLLEWWLNSHSETSLLNSSILPNNWISIIAQTLESISEEIKDTKILAEMLVHAVEKWVENALHSATVSFPLRALRIAIYYNTDFNILKNLETELFEFIANANDEGLTWLTRLIETQYLKPVHYATQLAYSELAFRRGDYSIADSNWRTYIEAPPPNATEFAISHALLQLSELHRLGSIFPDDLCFSAAIMARIARANTWEQACDLYKELLPAWRMPQLLIELQATQRMGALWSKSLVELWCTFHDRVQGTHDLLEVLTNSPHLVQETSYEAVEWILKKVILELLEKSNNNFPTDGILSHFWNIISLLEHAKLSFTSYIEDWANSLLVDNAKHKSASWILLDGIVGGILPLKQDEVCSSTLNLLNSANDSELPILWGIISRFKKVLPNDIEALQVQAIACRRMGRFTEAQTLWNELLNHPSKHNLHHVAHSALCSLHAEDGPLPDAESFVNHAFSAARTALDFKNVQIYYTMIRKRWSWDEIRPEILWHQDQIITIGSAQQLLEWWLNDHSGITKLASMPPMDGWELLIDHLTGIISEEIKSSDSLTDMFLQTIESWVTEAIQAESKAFLLHALRIGLFASSGRTPIDFEAEVFSIIRSANDKALAWLSNLVPSHKLLSEHHAIKLAQAELSWLRADYSAADKIWREYIESPPQEASEFAVDYVLTKLTDLHGPGSFLPDSECYNLALSVRINRADTWEKAKEMYKEILPKWTMSQLLEEIKATENRGDKWQLNLIAFWANYQTKVTGAGELLEALENILLVTSGNCSHVLKNVLCKIDSIDIASNRTIGLEWLKMAIETSKYSEFLICASLTGLISFDEANEIKVGRTVFFGSEDSSAAQYFEQYAARSMEDVISGKANYFFDGYTPGTAKALERWLQWFASLKDHSDKAAARIGEVIDYILQRDPAKLLIENVISVCMAYDVWTLSSIFPRVFFEVSDDNTASKYAAEYAPRCRVEVIAGDVNHCFHSYNPKTIRPLERWMLWFGELNGASAEATVRIGAVIDNFLQLDLFKETYDQVIALCEEYGIESLSGLLEIVRTTTEMIKTIEQITKIHLLSQLDGRSLTNIKASMPENMNEVMSDIYVAIFKAIKNKCKPYWKTPLVRLTEALVDSGRIDEANEIGGGDPELTFGKSQLTFEKYISRHKGVKRTAPLSERTINNIAEAYVANWQFAH